MQFKGRVKSRLESVAVKVQRTLKERFSTYNSKKATSVANAIEMAVEAKIKPTDVVMDPFGGTGFSSIIVSYFKPKRLLLSDLGYFKKKKSEKEPTPLHLMQEWEKHSSDHKERTKLEFIAAHANRLPFRDSMVDKIVTSPPFNLRMRDRKKQEEIFAESLKDLNRILKPGGLLVLKVPAFWKFEYMPFFGFYFLREKMAGGINRIVVFRLGKKLPLL